MILIILVTDTNRRFHLTCAFNMETEEQLNAWLKGFEAQV
jgi:hypothetical protein